MNMRMGPPSGAVCVRRPCSCHHQQQQTWSIHRLSPALVAAARLLQQQPHLAAAPALLTPSSSSSSLDRPTTVTKALSYLNAERSFLQLQYQGAHNHLQQHHQQQQQHRSSTASPVSRCNSGCETVGRSLRSSCCVKCHAESPGTSETSSAAAPEEDDGKTGAAQAAQQNSVDDNNENVALTAQDKVPSSTAAAAALARLQQVSQRIQAGADRNIKHQSAAAAAAATPQAGSSIVVNRQRQQQQQPIRPSASQEAALRQIEQQAPTSSHHQDRLLTWRTRKQQTSQQLPLQQQPPVQQQQQQQQQQQLPAPPLEPSLGPAGETYLTSPVSFVAATTSTKLLAGSISAAFAVHQHQLMFAVGPLSLSVAMKALATARVMMAAGNESRPVNILMQPTLRGGRTVRNQSYALDIARVGDLPMQPGGSSGGSTVTYGLQQQQQQDLLEQGTSSSSSSSSKPNQQQQQQEEEETEKTHVKIVHITSTSNELAAARSLVENMPARGQTVIRVAGPFATETAVLAIALSRPLFRQKYGQDLAVCVLWNENKKYNNKQSGLLLAVFRCAVDVFPPEVLLLPPSQRRLKKQQYWLRQQQRRQGKMKQQQAAQAS